MNKGLVMRPKDEPHVERDDSAPDCRQREERALAPPPSLSPSQELAIGETVRAARSQRTVRLRLSLGEERLEIVGPQGSTELSVILTENGPKLVFESADIQIQTVNRVTVDCGTFEVTARDDLSLRGASASIAARSGDVKIEANDRVRLMGEQIRLNCDNPDEVPAWMQREIAAELAASIMPPLVPRRDQTGDLTPTPPGIARPLKDD